MSPSKLFCAVLFTAVSPYGLSAGANGALNPAEQTAAIQAIREYALNYSKTLPNFTCTLATQHVSKSLTIYALLTTRIVEQLNFVDNKEEREIVKVEGDNPDSIRGPLSQGEFGTLLLTIFDPAKGTDLKWSRAATLEGHKVDVLAYHVPQASGYVLKESTGELKVPFEGLVYADRQNHVVLRIEAKCPEIPVDAEYRSVELKLDYGPAKVAGREYILPSHFVLEYVNKREDRQNLNDGRFSGYHEFSTDSEIQFGGDK